MSAHSAQGDYLRRRNDLWRRLRQLEPAEAGFEALLAELMALTQQSRAKLLEGLGLHNLLGVHDPLGLHDPKDT